MDTVLFTAHKMPYRKIRIGKRKFIKQHWKINIPMYLRMWYDE